MYLRPLTKTEVSALRALCKLCDVSKFVKVGSAKSSPAYVGRQGLYVQNPVEALELIREAGYYVEFGTPDELAAKGLLDVIMVYKEAK